MLHFQSFSKSSGYLLLGWRGEREERSLCEGLIGLLKKEAKGSSGAAEKLLKAVSTPPSVSSHCSFLSLNLHASPATMDRRSFQRPISGDLQQDSDAVGHHPAAPAPDRKPLRQGRRRRHRHRCGFIKQTNCCFLVRRRENTSNLDTTAGHNCGCPESIRR